MEAEGDQITERADVPFVPLRPDHERGVLDYTKLMSLRQREQCVHVDQRAWIMRRNDRAGGRRDGGFYPREIDIAGDEIAIHENRSGAGPNDHVENGEEALRPRNHLVTWSDVAKLQRDFDRRGRRSQ